MTEQPTSDVTTGTFFDLVRCGEKRKAPLVESLHAAVIDKANINQFVDAMNGLACPLASELIEGVWGGLDEDCKVHLLREWLAGRDKDQQVGGYHALAARLLSRDSEASMLLVGRVRKLAAGSPVCHRRAVSTTRMEWIGNSPNQARYRQLTVGHLVHADVLILLNWLTEACTPDIKPSDPEGRRADLRRQAEARRRVLSDWFVRMRNDQQPPDVLAAAIDQQLVRLGDGRPRQGVSPTETPTSKEPPRGERPAESSGAPAASPLAANEQSRPAPAANQKLGEALTAIEVLFRREVERHLRELRAAQADVVVARGDVERARKDAESYRAAAAKIGERVTQLDQDAAALGAERDAATKELEDARVNLASVTAELDSAHQNNQSLREESQAAVPREMQRERERLLTQVGQRIGNIVDNYREIRARGPLPDGSPAMIGAMMDELIMRLEAMGVKFMRE